MPLTPFQGELARLLSKHRTPDSYLAGGAALHIEPNTTRYSNDLDYFHDSPERVASAFAVDSEALLQHGYTLDVAMNQPGFIRALVSRGGQSTKVEWAHDSAWRFLPPVRHPTSGYQLHPLDLAVNKVLALVGRAEPRDFLDTLEAHRMILPLGALLWAASGKDPGFTPLSLFALVQRRGRYHPEDFARLHLSKQPDLPSLKLQWLEALAAAERFVQSRPPDELGCLYYSQGRGVFVGTEREVEQSDVVPHYGRPGGVLPRVRD